MLHNRKLSRSEWIDLLLAEADAPPPERPPKRRPPKKRGPMRDNSRNIAVHMTEEQFQRLERYRKMTRHSVTTYFRKLIAGDRLIGNRTGFHRNIHEEFSPDAKAPPQIAAFRAEIGYCISSGTVVS